MNRKKYKGRGEIVAVGVGGGLERGILNPITTLAARLKQ